jgi:hypothetical protein
MKAFLKFVLIPALAGSCFAATISTGSASWMVQQNSGLSNNGGPLGTPTSAVALTGTLPTAWVSAPGGSAWVGQLETDGNPSTGNCEPLTLYCGAKPGEYVYTLTIGSVGGVINFLNFTSDNSIKLDISDSNGLLQTLSSPDDTPFGALISGPTGLSFAGTLQIMATVMNSELGAPAPQGSRNPSGFLLSGDVTEAPEPSTYLMFGIGSAALFIARRRRN